MDAQTNIADREHLDPDFLAAGMEVYTYEYIEELRKQNLELKRLGKRSYNLVPQAGFQEKVLTNEADIKIVGGKRGSGKALSVDSMIVTPHGYKRLGDLKVGNYVSNPCTGSWEKVIQIFEHPNKDLFEVTFDDGSTCECCLDHLWKARRTGLVRRCDNNAKGWRIYTFAEIKKFLDEQADGKHYDRGVKDYFYIPLCEPIKFSVGDPWHLNLPKLDPYIIGALLGDGCITEKVKESGIVRFVSADEEIVQEFIKEGIDMAHFNRKNGGLATDYRIKDSRVNEILEKTNLFGTRSETKFIPEIYKWGKIETRLAILQGLMDTDGTVNPGGKCLYYTISERLAYDVRFIVESLGGVATIKRRESFYTKDGERKEAKPYYELYIKIKNPSRIFRLTRKKTSCTEFNGGVSETCRRIVSYRYVGKKDARCITVDSTDALYMAQDFIVTHNTFISLFGALPYSSNPDINMYGFRRYEADVKRGIWRSSKQVFRGLANFADTSFEAKFFNGTGATMKMEHLADLSKIKDRFRGAEMPYIVIEELAEFTKDSMSVIFDLIGSNRSTTGMPAQFICTCNPVGRSNKLRWFLDWWIDPETDEAIPARSGKIRYFCRYGEDVMEIAWGDTPEEVYENPNAKRKIQQLTDHPDEEYSNFITSVTFIDGDYAENKILQVSDPKYMNRISSGGSKSVINDIRGVWRDVDDSGALITMNDMNRFFENTPQVNGVRVGGGDIALRDDWLVLWAMDGMHIIDLYAKKYLTSEDVIPIILEFLKKNDIPKENFAFDVNGIGNWLKQSEDLKGCFGFDNKAPAKDKASYNTRKSECAGMLVDALQNGTISIDESILRKTYTEKRLPFTVRDRLVEERIVIKWKDDENPKSIIKKTDMKSLLGRSPDWIEALLYTLDRVDNAKKARRVRRGDWSFFGM